MEPGAIHGCLPALTGSNAETGFGDKLPHKERIKRWK
jgi:hypothetical protein